jgi:hypothetical protein
MYGIMPPLKYGGRVSRGAAEIAETCKWFENVSPGGIL